MNITEILDTVSNNDGSAFFYTPPIYEFGTSILFGKPSRTVTSSGKEDFYDSLNSITRLVEEGFIGYGSINYEAGYLLEEKLLPLYHESRNQILKFYFFEKDQVRRFNSKDIKYEGIGKLFQEELYKIDNYALNTDETEYKKNINSIRDYIRQGETYQVNYTVRGKFNFSGDISSLFVNLVFNQSARYSALMNSGGRYIISISPELFFEVDEHRILARPMKGTIGRGINQEEDLKNKEILKESAKEKAENIMILDLLRNDLGKIAPYNSVNVPAHTEIEKYESLFQMTSTVEAELIDNSFINIIPEIFPCGSITGAPKIRTMEIINELEKEERGVYTGAVGIVEKNRYKFNVPIRTITIEKEGKGNIGLGSGVVWDSDPEEEYKETLLKSNFLTKPEKYFELFESILIENGRLFLLDEHLKRLKEAAEYFMFNFDAVDIETKIHAYASKLDKEKQFKMKVLLNKWGEIKIISSLVNNPDKIIKIVVSNRRTDSRNKYQYFKTTNRKLYNEEHHKYISQGFYEVVFLNEKDEVTEGSFTNIFVKRDNEWVTPFVSSGLLNGIYRDYLLKHNINYKEAVVTASELVNSPQAFLVNSVRKKIKIDSIEFAQQ